MTDITIPPEALEAGKDAAFSWLRSYMEDDVRVREMTDDELTEVVSAACLAMLKNWPWKKYGTHHRHDVSIPFVMLSMAEVPNDND